MHLAKCDFYIMNTSLGARTFQDFLKRLVILTSRVLTGPYSTCLSTFKLHDIDFQFSSEIAYQLSLLTSQFTFTSSFKAISFLVSFKLDRFFQKSIDAIKMIKSQKDLVYIWIPALSQ